MKHLVQYGTVVRDTSMAPHPGKETLQILESPWGKRSRIPPITSHTQLSYLHLKSSCIKILHCSRSITNNAGGGEGKNKLACFNAMVFDHI